MKVLNKLIGFFVLVLILSCGKENINTNQTGNNIVSDPDKVFFENGIKWLWGGDDDDWHFNISSSNFNPERLSSGLGREFFDALLEPKYRDMAELASLFEDDDEFIILYAQEGIKAYSIDLLITHEVINDVVDGEPIMVGYCVLADFPAVYSRNHCGKTFTFAPSGYYYSEPGVWFDRDGFVLWDRDTESLWWPLTGKGISGSMIDVEFNTDLSFEWDRVDWNYIKSNYTDVEILAYGQEMETPSSWTPIKEEDLDCN